MQRTDFLTATQIINKAKHADIQLIHTKEYDIVTVCNQYNGNEYGYCGGGLLAELKPYLQRIKRGTYVEIYNIIL